MSQRDDHRRFGETADRAQSGIDRLLYLVVFLAVVVVVSPFVLDLAGITGGLEPVEAGTDGSPSLEILGVRGGAVGDGRSIGVLTVAVAPADASESVDLAEVTAVVRTDRGYHVTGPRLAGDDADGEFGIRTDGGGGGTVLQGSAARGEVRFDVGGDDLGGVPEIGPRIQPGDAVSVTLVTADGAHTATRLSVPDDLSGRESVPLG